MSATKGECLMNMTITERNERLTDPNLKRDLEQVVRHVCLRAGRSELIEDALQEAWMACVEAASKYDASSGAPFIAYLIPRARWAALHYCRRNSGAFSIPERMWRERKRDGGDDLSAALYAQNLSSEGADPGECELDHQAHASVSRASCFSPGRVARDEHIWREMDARELHNLIKRLAPNERYVAEKLLEEYNCAEIAREMGVTRQRVHQIKTSAFQKIRAWMGSPLAAA